IIDLCKSAFHLCAGEILISIIDRLELAAVDRNTRLREQAQLSAKGNELRANLADCSSVILAEIRNRLVVGTEPAEQPHDLNVASRLTLKSAARLHAIEVAIDVKLQQHRWMIGRPAGRLRINANEPKISQIEPVDKNVNDTNPIVLVDPILQALRKQRALSSILALNEALHLIPRISRGNPNSRITPDAAFSHSLGHLRRIVGRQKLLHVRNAPKATVGRQSVVRRGGPSVDISPRSSRVRPCYHRRRNCRLV